MRSILLLITVNTLYLDYRLGTLPFPLYIHSTSLHTSTYLSSAKYEHIERAVQCARLLKPTTCFLYLEVIFSSFITILNRESLTFYFFCTFATRIF